MRRTTTVASLLTGMILVAGCSSPEPDSGATGPSAFTAAEVNANTEVDPDQQPLLGLTPLEVWEKTKADADASPSVHVAGRRLDGQQFNLKMNDQGKVFGLVKLNGEKVLVRRLGKILYVKAGAPFWTRNAGAAKASALAYKWVVVRQTRTAELEQILQLTDLDYLVSDLMSLSTTEQEKLKLKPGAVVNRRKTVVLSDESSGDAGQARRLYVAATEPTMPLNYVVGTDKQQYLKFRSWGEDFTVVAPSGAVELTKRKSGRTG
jgi:hypothetical protein